MQHGERRRSKGRGGAGASRGRGGAAAGNEKIQKTSRHHPCSQHAMAGEPPLDSSVVAARLPSPGRLPSPAPAPTPPSPEVGAGVRARAAPAAAAPAVVPAGCLRQCSGAASSARPPPLPSTKAQPDAAVLLLDWEALVLLRPDNDAAGKNATCRFHGGASSPARALGRLPGPGEFGRRAYSCVVPEPARRHKTLPAPQLVFASSSRSKKNMGTAAGRGYHAAPPAQPGARLCSPTLWSPARSLAPP
jgi:hypothetical protein